MEQSVILTLLEQKNWNEDTVLITGLKDWRYYPILRKSFYTIRENALYQSMIHGKGHIHRTLLLAGLLAWRQDLSEPDTIQYFRAVSYHDVGRVFDGYDTEHGARSALRMAELTGQTGENLRELQAAVEAHSRADNRMVDTVQSYRPSDYGHALELARLLKDADNLDRVRIRDLDPAYLRHDSAKELAAFAQHLLDRYLEIAVDERAVLSKVHIIHKK